MLYKPEIRKKLRAERRQLDPKSIENASKQVAAQLIHLTPFIECKKLGFYFATENELDPEPTIHCAIDLEKKLFLPAVPTDDSKVMPYYSYHPNDELIKNHLGIEEPNTEKQECKNAADLDLIFLPLVGFDAQCNRLGRGAGYFDYTLAFKQNSSSTYPILIGLGYEFQKISAIEPSKWDIPLDYIATEENIYRR